MMPSFRDQAMEMLAYDPEAGIFTWKVKRNCHGGGIVPGVQAGQVSGQGYILIGVFGRLWRAHRLAWLFQTGTVPAKGYEIDHINGDRADNRWANLRLVTRTQNNLNRGLSRANRSGFKGVSWASGVGKWDARIKISGVTHWLGTFHDKADAVKARQEAEARLCPEYRVVGERIARPRHA